jgi:aspartate carbamoyltransferase catalytic subunit
MSFPSVLEGIGDLSLEQIRLLLDRAKEYKKLALENRLPFSSHPLNSKIYVATFFMENSTRTKLSFTRAIELLGAKHLNFDPESSSIKKGEKLKETMLTLRALGIDIVIYRTSVARELEQFKKDPPVLIINGGDGTHQHPTQALLDLFTMIECDLDPKGKTIVIAGDVLHSRVTGSLAPLLEMWGAKIILSGPAHLIPEKSPSPNITVEPDLDRALKHADMLYLLRAQFERHTTNYSMQDYCTGHGACSERIHKLERKIPIFHPGPANIGVEITQEIIDSDLYMGNHQVAHGIYMRMAVLDAMFRLRIEKPNSLKDFRCLKP